jgi:ABC-type glycerol-3-phosphate transport system substrate-binding protein
VRQKIGQEAAMTGRDASGAGASRRRVLRAAAGAGGAGGLWLAACAGPAGSGAGREAAPPAPEKVSGKVVFFSVHASGKNFDGQQAAFRLFNEQNRAQGLEVEVRPGPGNYAKQREQILLEHTAGTPADLYENGWGAWTDLVDGGVLEDLGPYARRDKIDPPALFLPNMIEAWTHNGKLYALPMSVSTDVVGYNRDLFDAAGVKVPPVNLEDKTWTMEAFLEAAQKLTRGTEQFGFSGSLNRANPAGATEGTYFGQPPWDEARKKCLMNTPNFIKGMQFFLDVKDKWRVQPDAERARELSGPQNVPLFLTGKVAMHAVGGEVIGQTVPFKWALGSIPYSGPGKNQSGRHWSQGLHLDAGSKAREGAWRVYRWLMEPANNVEYTIPFGQPVTALKAAQESLQRRWTQETGVDGKAYALTASVSLPSGGGMLKYGTWTKVLDQLTPLFTDMKEGRLTVKDYADRATAIIDRDLVPQK